MPPRKQLLALLRPVFREFTCTSHFIVAKMNLRQDTSLWEPDSPPITKTYLSSTELRAGNFLKLPGYPVRLIESKSPLD